MTSNRAWAVLEAIGSGSVNVDLTADKTSIGRKENNDVRVANNKLSAQHCCIYREAAGVFVEDLSSNGTYINDTKMSKGAKLPLSNGDKLWLLHPSKIKEAVGYEFKLTSTAMDIQPKKEDKKQDNKSNKKQDSKEDEKAEKSESVPDKSEEVAKKKAQVQSKKAESDSFKNSIKDQITCPMCLEIMFIPVAVHPCNHRFCGSCLTTLVKSKKSECIKCRKQITTAQRDSSFTSIIEDYLKSHPEEKRSKEEEQDLRKANIFGSDTVDVCEMVTGKKASALTDDSSSARLLKSGRAPGVTLKSTSAPKRATKKTVARKGSDLSAKSSDDDDDGTRDVCRECMVERNKFKCSPTQTHVACSNCHKLMAWRNDDALQQRCVICQEYFCNLYFPPCKSTGNKLTLVSERFRSARIDKENFRGNDFQLTTYTNYLMSKKLTARNVFDMMIRDYLNKDQFRYLSDRKILAVAPASSHEVTVRGNSAVCDVCWKLLWFQMVLRHRMNINSELPPAISGRADCYYGINCTTMVHKLDHAKKLNHCCYQTRFH